MQVCTFLFNSLQVLIPKYGLEGTLFLRREKGAGGEGKENNEGPVFVFDEEVPSQVGYHYTF